MSKHHHSSITFEITRLVNEVKAAQLEDDGLSVHGIDILSDGTVYDIINQKTYKTLMLWAESVINEEMGNDFQYMHQKQYFDDEY
jgi:hypothetical protein